MLNSPSHPSAPPSSPRAPPPHLQPYLPVTLSPTRSLKPPAHSGLLLHAPFYFFFLTNVAFLALVSLTYPTRAHLSHNVHTELLSVYRRASCHICFPPPLPSTLRSPQVKCDQYWPTRGTETYGLIQVTLLDTVELATYSVRTFALYKVTWLVQPAVMGFAAY